MTTVDDNNGEHELAIAVARAADEKLASDIMVIDVGDVLAICESFVIVSGRTSRQVRAIADEIEEQIFLLHDRKPRAVEGLETRTWVLMDYGDVIVHVFAETERAYYRLERLYSDAPQIEWKAPADASAPPA